MIDNIKNLGNNPKTRTSDSTNKEVNGSKSDQNTSATASAPNTKDEVQISAQAKKLNALKDSIMSTPEIDQAEVDKIKTALESGEYKVDVKNLANKMLNSFKANL